jgi:hypothetical protein
MGGLVVGLMGLLIALALQRWGYARIRRFARRVMAGHAAAGAVGG